MFTKDGNPIDITLDGGATGSFIKHSVAVQNNFKIWPNFQSAGLADSKTSVRSIGYVEEVFYRDKWSVKFKGLVVENLKANVYGGQPFMIENDVIQRPAKSIITVLGKHTVMQTNQVLPTKHPYSAAMVTLAKMNVTQTVLYPGQSINVPYPNNLPEGPVLLTPRTKELDKPTPTIQDSGEQLCVINSTKEPLMIPEDLNVIDITSCQTINMENIQTKPHINNPIPANKQYKAIQKNINTDKINQPQLSRLNKIHETYQDVFDGNLNGYNGRFGKHVVSLQWADQTRPKTARIHVPSWSSSKDVILQKKIDQLTEMGVLTDPYQHNIAVKCVHPCFLQKKGRAAHKNIEDCTMDELRFLTAPTAVNDKCRQVQTQVPDQNEIFKFLANNKYVIFADLYESFFQNHLNKSDWGYIAINSPYKGLRVYTRSTQGLLNQDEELGQLLSKVLGQDIMEGHCMKIADDLIVGGNSVDEAITHWESVLQKLSESNLKLSPGKVRIFPHETVIYGWSIKDGTMTPDPHRQLALSKTKHSDIHTVADLRSWIGVYKTFLIAMPGLAQIMDPFEKLTAGIKDNKMTIQWTPELIQLFQDATEKSKNSIKYLTLPRKDEQLLLMPDATVRKPAIGFTLNVIRDEKLLPVIFYSFKLTDTQSRWWPCEQEALAVATAIKKCNHYILTSTKPTLILSDSKPVVEAFNLMKKGKFSTSSRMAAFLYTTNQYRIDIQHISGKFKQNLAPDYLSRNPASCENKSCQICLYIKESTACVSSSITINTANIINNELNVLDYTHTGPLLIQSFGDNHGSSPVKQDVLPLGNIHTWKKLQEQDFACTEAMKRLTSGQQPNKKGPLSNDIRKYYNHCQAKELLVAVDQVPNTTQYKSRIVIPKDFVPAVLTQLHHREANHPTAYQLEKLFNRHFYGIHVKQITTDITNSCHLCKSNKALKPFITEFKPQSNPQHPGTVFNIDIMRRNSQKIMVCRDLFSSFTTTTLVKSEQANCLLNGIIQCVTPVRNQEEILIRTDSATGFKALSNNPTLIKLGISIETTDPSNKNSIGTVDNAIKELEQELIKLSPHESAVNDALLAMATKSMNSKIRNRDLSASEILFARENKTNNNLHFKDNDLADKQQNTKSINNVHSQNSKFKGCTKQTYQPNKGDTIVLVNDKDKTKSRDVFLITNTMKDKSQINKIMKFHTPLPKIQIKSRIVPNNAIYPIHEQPHHSRPTYQPPIQSVQAPNTNANNWTPMGNYDTLTDDEDTDQTLQLLEPEPEKHHHQDQNQTPDPYAQFKSWESKQRRHALNSVKKPGIAGEIQCLIDDLDQSYHEMCSPNLDESTEEVFHDANYVDKSLEWDSQYEFQNHPRMDRVNYVDNLYDQAEQDVNNINTNKVQNLEHVLPILPEIQNGGKKKKKISPPRAQLPIERELTYEDTTPMPMVTRSQTSGKGAQKR